MAEILGWSCRKIILRKKSPLVDQFCTGKLTGDWPTGQKPYTPPKFGSENGSGTNRRMARRVLRAIGS